MSQRQRFIQNDWLSYPAFSNPQKDQLVGRLQDLNIQSWEEVIELGPCRNGIDISISREQFGQIIHPDDWVVINTRQQKAYSVFLLAPALAEPLQLQSSPAIQKNWFEFLSQVRIFFLQKKFHQAQTPTIVACPGTEPFLDLFSTELMSTGVRKKMYLTTSPEIHLKKMLSAGYKNVFEFKNCFRNGEFSNRHRHEFTMLEWYRSLSSLDLIIEDCLELIEFLGGSTEDHQRKSMSQLFLEKLDFNLTPRTSIEELKILGKKCHLSVESYELWDDVFYHIFIEKIEPFLSTEAPLFVEKYPPSQAAFARLTEDGWGDRFEIYWKNLEIGNAFHELNDPVVQERRMREDLEKKSHLKKELPPLDEQFIQALRSGMPPSSGIAVGLERLFMALNGITDIGQLRTF